MGFLDEKHLDIMKEIGNIGAGNAATSLSKLLNRRVDMNMPKIKIINFNEVEEVVGGAETLVAGIYLEIMGDIDGTIMFILDRKSANNLLSLLIGDHEFNIKDEFSSLEVSALQEVANILTGAYLGSLSALTGLKIKPSIPTLAYDMAGAILSVPMIEFGQIGDRAFFIETILSHKLNQIKGNLFLIPSIDSYPIILNSLGIN